jgi:PAS domain S-box-containing protein
MLLAEFGWRKTISNSKNQAMTPASNSWVADGPINLLLVDDQPRNLEVLETILESPEYHLIRASSGDDALLALMKDEFAAIVLDIQMPGMSGLELARLIKQRKRNQHIPILFLTAHFLEDTDILEGYGVGAVDYLTKPINPQILKSKVAVFVELFRTTRALARANSALESEISSRKEAQEALRRVNNELEGRVRQRTMELSRSEEQFRRAIEDAPIPVIMHAEDGQVLQISKTWASLTGYTMEEVPTFDAWLTRAYGFGANEVRNAVRSLFERDTGIAEVEFEIITRSGQKRVWAFSASSPGVLSDGRRFVVGTAVDITERKSAEELLRQSEERYRHLVHALPAAIYTCDAQGRIMLYNQAAVALWGREPEVGKDLWCGSGRIYKPDGTPLMPDESPMLAAIREDRPNHGEEIMVERPDGSRRFVMVYPHSIHDARGQLTGAVNMLVDITDRKRAETALRESEAFARSVLEGSADCIKVLDPEGRLLSMNGPGMRLMEIDDFQSVARTEWLDFWKDEHRVAARTAFDTARAGGTARFQGVCHTASGKPKWWDVALSPISNSESHTPQLVCISRDITESKKAELALQEAKEAAEAASKAKDHFLATLSHELRTPLNPALLLTTDRERDSTLPADVRHDFAAIHKDIEMEAQLIDDLLDLTRISHGKLRVEPRPIDLHSLLRASWERLKTEANEKQLQVRFDLSAPTPWVKADPVRLQQVFWNVLRNALRFTPAKGRITLRSYAGKSDHWCVDIIDDGVGIEPHELEQIFTPFEQGLNGHRFGGIGLGLAISRQLIQLQGGRITAKSDGRGRGAIFTVELPGAQPATEDVGVPSSNAGNERHGTNRRILLVEDHNQTRATLARLLTQRGHEVATAENIEEALVRAQTFAFDLVLSDLGLPDGSGHDLIKELRQMRPGCRGIALSGYGMESDTQRSIDSGFDAHLTKPVDIRALEKALNASSGV